MIFDPGLPNKSYPIHPTREPCESHGVPAEHLIVGEVVALQDRLELLANVLVVGLGVEVEVADVLQQHYQLGRQLVAQHLRTGH